jgi:WhiB family redox-sensing transcriptional regulator
MSMNTSTSTTAAPAWHELALCAQTGPDFFFPEPGTSLRDAKRLCGACEGRAGCLEYALTHDERFGVWGGLSERERLALRQSR